IMELNKIYNVDCLEGMRKMENSSIDLVVTSPPYDNLRDYKGYTLDINGVIEELYRVVKHGGIVVWVVGDATINGSESGSRLDQNMELNKKYNVYWLEGMRKMENSSIDLVVTSPPYDNLRDYKGYTLDINGVIEELYRVVKHGGIVVWVVGDATINGSESGSS